MHEFYFASKAFVLSFSEALSEELAPLGIRVTAVCPGPVPTEFQARAGQEEDWSPLMMRKPDSVARRRYFRSKFTRVAPGAMRTDMFSSPLAALMSCWIRS